MQYDAVCTSCKLKPVAYKVEYCSNVYFGCKEYWFMNYFLDTHVRKDLWSSPTSHPHPLWTSVWWQTSILEEPRNTPGRDLGSFKTLPLEDCRTALGLFSAEGKKYF